MSDEVTIEIIRTVSHLIVVLIGLLIGKQIPPKGGPKPPRPPTP